MSRRVLLAGLRGAVALLAWTVAVNAGFGFSARLTMKQVTDERVVHAVLVEHIGQPGAYVVNPAPSKTGAFPPGEPVFGIRYGGVGHEAAGRLAAIELLTALVSATLAAGLLTAASARVRSRYGSRVAYVATIGLLLAVFGDVPVYGIGGYPAGDVLWLAASHLASWVLAGAAMALGSWPGRESGEREAAWRPHAPAGATGRP